MSKLESSKPDPFKPGLTTTEDHMSPEYDLSDLAVFTRELICRKKAERDVNIFFLRVKVLPHLNRVNLFRDYHLISQVKPAEGRPDVFGILEGINE